MFSPLPERSREAEVLLDQLAEAIALHHIGQEAEWLLASREFKRRVPQPTRVDRILREGRPRLSHLWPSARAYFGAINALGERISDKASVWLAAHRVDPSTFSLASLPPDQLFSLRNAVITELPQLSRETQLTLATSEFNEAELAVLDTRTEAGDWSLVAIRVLAVAEQAEPTIVNDRFGTVPTELLHGMVNLHMNTRPGELRRAAEVGGLV